MNYNLSKYIRNILLLVFFSFVLIVSAQEEISKPDSVIIQADSSIEIDDNSQIIEMLDSLVHIKYFGDYKFITDTLVLNVYNYSRDSIPVFPDSVIKSRIELLNGETPFELTYNKNVKAFINLYAVKKRELTSKMLGLAEVYFPLFEEQLDKYNIPLELKYLAIVESALNPRAGSHAGAKGLWQFMYGTGKVYGLKVTSLIDERYDPLKATVAACEHLRDLYNIYGNWSLALAAYNSGAGNVNKALRRSGYVKSYWAVWPFLPRETRGYVPAFIAVNYVMNYSAEHNLYPIDPGILFNEIDTIKVKDVLSFDQISEMLGVPYEDVKFLNPQYKKQIIPPSNGNEYFLRLPKKYIGDFIDNETALYNYKTKKGIERDKLLAQIEKAKSRNFHIVRSGENLGVIAKRYRCYISQLKRWNNLRGNTIFPGQKLIVYGSAYSSGKQKSSKAPVKRSTKGTAHIVKNGENLALIAKKYNCSVTDLKEWNNLRNSKIFPKQKLIVYKPVSSSSKSGKYVYHTIRKGDTLWDIAKEYDGVTVEQIKRLNSIRNYRRLKPGQKIKIAVVG
ncbi:MAG: LysM peptidoglycan-binding domain-containing protein [Bacteroidales bacterium]|nr:LysM peptidoglycan-binding domain-containing protein [Bacteroidales bacterium]